MDDDDEGDERRITSLDEIPEDDTFLFTVRSEKGDEFKHESEDKPGEFEVILTRDGDDVRAWKNYCQHWTDVRLDTGDGAPMRNGEIVCEKHGAYFETDTGYCNYGPCEGSRLEKVEVVVEKSDVYLGDGY
ncbi:MAG: Rieske 2Fe-2S domain-containing protein, partial [Halobacteria archaeon]|nr:Rieske 2Fe-2S domain-containing protein [Halobacteria archaeon]